MQRIHADQRQAAAMTLATAFHDDPILQILQPDQARRSAFCTWFMGVMVTYGLRRHGEVWGNEDASAVAIWLPPGRTDVGAGGLLRAGIIALPLKVGLRGVARAMGVMSATDRFHKQVKGPHWYLMALGTRPDRQGQGLGSALTEVGTAQADAAGLPCYLETATDANVAYYRKRGFEVTGKAQVGGFTISAMVRPPA